MYSIASMFDWKSHLLVHGCRVAPHHCLPANIAMKKIHLYAHSQEKNASPIPDDILLPDQTIVRIRYRSHSPFIVEPSDTGHHIRNEQTGQSIPIHFVTQPNFSTCRISNLPISSICSFLGNDLLGITPSNYCFYFQSKKQCRFCEILPTFKKEVEFPKTFKNLDVIENAIIQALQQEQRLRFIAITTGNIHSYDATVDYFLQIGKRLQTHSIFQNVEQVLATLMPPDDLSKIPQLRKHGFTKIYFPLEVFHPVHFATVCPGKADYGYDRIIRALEIAVDAFGEGNVYTNFVYGIQSLDESLSPHSYHPQKENDLAIKAVEGMLAKKVIPAFTLYHYSGENAIGHIALDPQATQSFFRTWGTLVRDANIIPPAQQAVLFSYQSLSNTLFNDGFRLANYKESALWI